MVLRDSGAAGRRIYSAWCGWACLRGECGHAFANRQCPSPVTGFDRMGGGVSDRGGGPGIDEAEFRKQAEQAKRKCPVSKVLAGAEITLDARLIGG